MPNRTRQSNKRRPARPEVTITPTESGIPAEWQQPSKPQQRPERSGGSPSRSRAAEPSTWQQPSRARSSDRRTRGSPPKPVEPSNWQSPETQRRSSPQRQQSAPRAQGGENRRRRKKRRPPLSTVLFPGLAQRRRAARRRNASPDSRADRQKQRLRRQQRYLVLSRLFTLLVIVGTGILALTLFFKVETVTVDGHSRYTNSQLLETAGIEQGDNLFLLPTRGIRRRLFDEYPYLDTVRIERKPPNSVVLHVEDAVPAAAVGSGTTYYYMDAGGKLLEQVTMEQLGSIPVVTGVTIEGGEVGRKLNMRRDERLQQLTILLTALEEQGLMARVDFINLSDMSNVRIGYNDHMYIRFGTMDQLDYKMRFAKKFVEETSPSLYCEIEVSGEILWEGHPSYRVIPVTQEDVVAQSRDIDEAAEAQAAEEAANAEADANAAAPVLGGTGQNGENGEGAAGTEGGDGAQTGDDSTSNSGGDGSSGDDSDDSSGTGGDDSSNSDEEDDKNNSDENDDGNDDNGDSAQPASPGNAPALNFPTGGVNWRNAT